MSNDHPTPPGRPGEPRHPHDAGDEAAHPFFGRADRPAGDAAPARPAPGPPAPLTGAQPGYAAPAGRGAAADPFADGGEFGSWFDDEPVRAPHVPATPDRGTPAVPGPPAGTTGQRRTVPPPYEPAHGYDEPYSAEPPAPRAPTMEELLRGFGPAADGAAPPGDLSRPALPRRLPPGAEPPGGPSTAPPGAVPPGALPPQQSAPGARQPAAPVPPRFPAAGPPEAEGNGIGYASGRAPAAGPPGSFPPPGPPPGPAGLRDLAPGHGSGPGPGPGPGHGPGPGPGHGHAPDGHFGPAPGQPGAGPEGPAAAGPPPAGEPADGGLPRRAGRRSLIGAFGAPADPAAQTPAPAGAGTPPSPEPADADRTMTTRVTIKIPGSRPIPPVVLRGQAPMPVAGNATPGAPGDPGQAGYATTGTAPAYDVDEVFPDERPQPARRDTAETPARTPAPARPARPRGRRRLVLASAAGVALLGGLYGASLAYAGGGVPRGTTVLGIGIGGQSPAEAQRTLDKRLGERALAPMPVRIGDKEVRLDPVPAGLTLDTKATVEAAGTRSFNPFKSIPAMFGAGSEVEPRVTSDPVKIAAALEQLAADAGGQPREGGVTFAGGKAAAVAPQVIDVVDIPAAVGLVRGAYLREDRPLPLPMTRYQPKVSQAEVDRALREFGVPAMSGPVTLTAGGKQLRLTPQVLAKYLSMAPDPSGRLTPRIDADGLQKELGGTFSGVGEKPQDATFKVVGGKVTIVPSKPGRGVSGQTAAQALLPVLPKKDGRTARVELGPVEPEFTTAEAEALGVTQVMSEYRTEYEPAPYRITNIHRAADLIDGGVVAPGATWSLNRTVGERTAENGFAKGTIINNGRFETDYGGGVSQVATTMWNAVFFAGLQDVQHKAHSFWIPRYPAGREATVAWPSLDLKWTNDSGKPVYVQAEYTNTSVTIRLFGTRRYDEIKSISSAKYDIVKPKSIVDSSAGCVPQEASDGFRIDVTRVFIQDGREVKREKFPTKYDPADRIECAPSAPAPKPGSATAPPSAPPGRTPASAD